MVESGPAAQPAKTKGSTLAKRLLFLALFCAVLAFAGTRLARDLDELDELPQLGPTLLAVAACALFYLFISAAWVRLSGPVIGPRGTRLHMAFLASQPYKYLPSSIFTFTARVRFARWAGLSWKRAAALSVLDGVLLAGSGAAIWVVGLWPWGTVGVALLAVGVFGGWTWIELVLDILWRRRGVTEPPRIDRVQLFQVSGLYSAGWIASGLAVSALAVGFGADVGLSEATNIVRINALAFAASILAVFAPAGLGVRETLLLSADLDAEVIVSWRIVTVGFDIIGGTVGALVLKRLWRSSQENQVS